MPNKFGASSCKNLKVWSGDLSLSQVTHKTIVNSNNNSMFTQKIMRLTTSTMYIECEFQSNLHML